MNEREETVPATPPRPLPPAQARALEAAAGALTLAASVKPPFRPIAEQVIRAAASVPANVAEGQGRSGQDRLYHWRVAYGSARELEVHLTLLADAGAIDRPAAARLLAQLDEVRAMLGRMTHPR
ncbi:MAG: four helix bundle protein [Acidobacteriota bacterium]|jgi:four helix bundle protein